MRDIAALGGFLLLLFVLGDCFESIILPRRVTRRWRLVRLFYRTTWAPWSALAQRIKAGKRREAFLSYFGPLSLLVLFAVWAAGLVIAFALLHWSAGSAINLNEATPGFWSDLYLSGTTFFTLGLGDVTPRSGLARAITVCEAGIGFGFLAIVVSYLPVLYGAFSRREVNISLLDARAGSPPTATELLRRHAERQKLETLETYLHDWENWSAELMESHLSYPILCYFRSQHDNQSWLAALATILDTCALVLSCGEGALKWQAHLTFAISRHAVVDLTQVLNIPPRTAHAERFSAENLAQLHGQLAQAGVSSCSAAHAVEKLIHLRAMYEPYLNALSDRLMMPLPVSTGSAAPRDNWRTSAWARSSSEVSSSAFAETSEEEH